MKPDLESWEKANIITFILTTLLYFKLIKLCGHVLKIYRRQLVRLVVLSNNFALSLLVTCCHVHGCNRLVNMV